MKILVVDEPKAGGHIRQRLEEAGFTVDMVSDGMEGLRRTLIEAYDLVILEVVLSGIDGWQVLRGIRQVGKDVPVMFLSARDGVDDRVKGLELGADDYLTKPFSSSELLARARTLLRRGARGRELEYLRAGDLELDLKRCRVVRSGKRIDLTSMEFCLLRLLLRRQGEVLPRSFIASQIWGANSDGDTDAVKSAIRRLRAKVDGQYERKLLHAVRGIGYVLEAREGSSVIGKK